MGPNRQSPRTTATGIHPIQLEPNIGAIVLNVSDGGMAFRALSPVKESGTIRFSFVENGLRIEASGDLVWIDAMKTTGGLRFKSLPPASRERIRNWVNRPEASESPESYDQPSPKPVRESSRRAPQANTEPTPSFPAPGAPSGLASGPSFVMLEDQQTYQGYPWEETSPYHEVRSRFFAGFLSGVIFSVILAGVLFFVYGNPTNPLLAQWREEIGLRPQPKPVPALPSSGEIPLPAAAPELPHSGNLSGNKGHSASPVPSAPSAPAQEGSTVDSSIEKAPEEPSSNGGSVPHPPEKTPPPTTEPGQPDLALAQRYLADQPGPAGSAAAARALWIAVQKGNVEAEIILADLYARGDGVTKNCNQARVLLRAASKKGSTEAAAALAQILRRGCG